MPPSNGVPDVDLKERERAILDFYREFTARRGRPPGMDTCAKALGYSQSSVHAQLQTLVLRGLLVQPKAYGPYFPTGKNYEETDTPDDLSGTLRRMSHVLAHLSSQVDALTAN